MTDQADFTIEARVTLQEELVDAIALSLDDASNVLSVG